MSKRVVRLIRIIFFFMKLFTSRICAIVLSVFYERYRDVWILAERGDDARDNGFFFYKFLKLKHPEINSYYVITIESSDFKKVDEIGNCLKYNSFKHFVFLNLAKIRLSSSMWGGDLPYADYFFKLRKIVSCKAKFIFLKHGIVKDYLPQHCVCNAKPDIYICGAKPEYEYVLKNFGYTKDVVKYTGLARFDNLHNSITKNQILIMPTFRRWLQGERQEDISKSEFVRTWNNILNDKKLEGLLEEKGIELIFYPHYILQKQIDVFSADSKHVVIAKFKEYDVQQLLIESKLLITDFSSVFFDFRYMGKPIIYYQFDRKRYISEHYDYTKGYFDYDNMGFGDVIQNHDECIALIRNLISDDFQMDDKYKQRIQSFFPLHDMRNCERIFNCIMRLEKKYEGKYE